MPSDDRRRYQIGLLNLIALVVVAGAAFGMTRQLREGSYHTLDKRFIVPLLALTFWLGVVLAEGIVTRLRRPTGQGAPVRGVLWRAVAILMLAAFSADLTRLLGRLQRLWLMHSASRVVPRSVAFEMRQINWRLQILAACVAALLFGVVSPLPSRRSAGTVRSGVAWRRPAVAGWLLLAILAAAPFLAVRGIPHFRPWRWIEGLPGDDHWTMHGRMAPMAALGLLAWLVAADWLRRDLRRVAPHSPSSAAYRLATLAAVIVAAVALVVGPLGHETYDENSMAGLPLDRTTMVLLTLVATGVAAGLIARATCPDRGESTRSRGWSPIARVARASGIVALVAATIVLAFLDAWNECLYSLESAWPTPIWRSLIRPAIEWLDRVIAFDPHALLWIATTTALAVLIVARLGPRTAPGDRGPASRWSLATAVSLATLRFATVLAIASPYLIEKHRIWTKAFQSVPLVGDALDWLDSKLGGVIDTIDIELIFLAPGVYWLASRWYDSFAPPPAAPLDVVLADGAGARRFLARWATASILAVAAMPLAYASFVILLG